VPQVTAGSQQVKIMTAYRLLRMVISFCGAGVVVVGDASA
jgi:hypothetical protein